MLDLWLPSIPAISQSRLRPPTLDLVSGIRSNRHPIRRRRKEVDPVRLIVDLADQRSRRGSGVGVCLVRIRRDCTLKGRAGKVVRKRLDLDR